MSPLTRREFLKISTVTAGMLASQTLLSACDQNPAVLSTKPAPTSGNVLGVGRGIFPGRVVWAHNPQAALWDGQSDFWWAEKFTDQDLVSEMFSHSLRQLTGQANDKAAWEALFTHFKTQHGQTGSYRPGEKIAIKANLNGSKNHSDPKNNSFVSPAVAFALLDQLVQAGVKPDDITLYDASRAVPNPIVSTCK